MMVECVVLNARETATGPMPAASMPKIAPLASGLNLQLRLRFPLIWVPKSLKLDILMKSCVCWKKEGWSRSCRGGYAVASIRRRLLIGYCTCISSFETTLSGLRGISPAPLKPALIFASVIVA